MGDTGVDVNHCMFRDDSVQFSNFQNEPGRQNFAKNGPLQYFDSTSHRKIRFVNLFDIIDKQGLTPSFFILHNNLEYLGSRLQGSHPESSEHKDLNGN